MSANQGGKKLLCSVYGAIEKLLVVYKADKPELLKYYKSLLATLPGYTQLIIWADDQESQDALKYFLENMLIDFQLLPAEQNSLPNRSHARVCVIPDPNLCSWDNDSHWVQDGFLVLENEASNIKTLVRPSFDGGGTRNEKLVMDLCELLEEYEYGKKMEWFSFEGGDVLRIEEQLIIGQDFFAKTLENFRCKTYTANDTISEEELIDSCKEELCKLLGVDKVIPIGMYDGFRSVPFNQGINCYSTGGIRTPMDHIDQYLTYAGKSADNNLPQIVLAKLRSEEPNSNQRFIEKKNTNLDKIAAILKEEGFIVYRNLVPVYERNLFGYYNNALIEIKPDKKSIWMPFFGEQRASFREYDEANYNLWRDLGFEIYPIQGLLNFSQNRGALHCLVKCLQRSRN